MLLPDTCSQHPGMLTLEGHVPWRCMVLALLALEPPGFFATCPCAFSALWHQWTAGMCMRSCWRTWRRERWGERTGDDLDNGFPGSFQRPPCRTLLSPPTSKGFSQSPQNDLVETELSLAGSQAQGVCSWKAWPPALSIFRPVRDVKRCLLDRSVSHYNLHCAKRERHQQLRGSVSLCL